MIKIVMNTKQYEKRSKKINKAFNRGWTKQLFRYGDLITSRMSRVHLYQNRTGDLSRSNKYKVTVKAKRLTFKNNMFYAKYVRRWENRKRGSNTWANAVAFYRKRFIKDLDDLGKQVGKIR